MADNSPIFDGDACMGKPWSLLHRTGYVKARTHVAIQRYAAVVEVLLVVVQQSTRRVGSRQPRQDELALIDVRPSNQGELISCARGRNIQVWEHDLPLCRKHYQRATYNKSLWHRVRGLEKENLKDRAANGALFPRSYVGNIHFSVTEPDLQQIFKPSAVVATSIHNLLSRAFHKSFKPYGELYWKMHTISASGMVACRRPRSDDSEVTVISHRERPCTASETFEFPPQLGPSFLTPTSQPVQHSEISVADISAHCALAKRHAVVRLAQQERDKVDAINVYVWRMIQRHGTTPATPMKSDDSIFRSALAAKRRRNDCREKEDQLRQM
ncbi:hypothetical protein ACEQ8H_005798 [Pleosporales sp. CAS-2024a]